MWCKSIRFRLRRCRRCGRIIEKWWFQFKRSIIFILVCAGFFFVAFLFLSLSYIFTIMMESNEWVQGYGMCVWAHVDSVENNFLRLTTIKSLASTAIASNDFDIRKPKVDANRQSELKCSGPRCAWNRCWRLAATKTETRWYREVLRTYTFTWWPAFSFRISSTARIYSLFFCFLFVSVPLPLLSPLQRLACHFSMPINASKAYL